MSKSRVRIQYSPGDFRDYPSGRAALAVLQRQYPLLYIDTEGRVFTHRDDRVHFARVFDVPSAQMGFSPPKRNPWWTMTDTEMAQHKQRLAAEAAKERAMRRGAVGTRAATKSKAACGAKRNPAHARGKAAMRGITKTGIVQHITEHTGVTTKQAREVLDEVAALARRELAKTGQFTVPNVATLRVVKTAARKARSGTNPFTGQAMKIPAKPAGKAVKAKPAGALRGRK